MRQNIIFEKTQELSLPQQEQQRRERSTVVCVLMLRRTRRKKKTPRTLVVENTEHELQSCIRGRKKKRKELRVYLSRLSLVNAIEGFLNKRTTNRFAQRLVVKSTELGEKSEVISFRCVWKTSLAETSFFIRKKKKLSFFFCSCIQLLERMITFFFFEDRIC